MGLQLTIGVLAHEWYIQWWSYNQGRAYRVLTDVHGGFAPLVTITWLLVY